MAEGKTWPWWVSVSGKWPKVPFCKTTEHHYFLGQGSIETSTTLDAQNSADGESTTEISDSNDTEEIFDSKDKEKISDSEDTEQIPLTKVVVVDEEEEGSEGESFSYILIFYFCIWFQCHLVC